MVIIFSVSFVVTGKKKKDSENFEKSFVRSLALVNNSASLTTAEPAASAVRIPSNTAPYEIPGMLGIKAEGKILTVFTDYEQNNSRLSVRESVAKSGSNVIEVDVGRSAPLTFSETPKEYRPTVDSDVSLIVVIKEDNSRRSSDVYIRNPGGKRTERNIQQFYFYHVYDVKKMAIVGEASD